jgi:hypothetical protein
MNDDSKQDKSQQGRIIDKFDRVLKRHIRRLLDGSDLDMPPYSLNMVAALLVLIEHEKEIIDAPEASPNRYNQASLLRELDEIGIEVDENIALEIQELLKTGYIDIDADETFHPLELSAKFLSLLDTIFPSMPGLSLIAYILQGVEEVMSGRKEMLQAVRQFDETLLTRGESVSKQRFEALRRQRAAAAAAKKLDPATQKQRNEHLEILKALRSRQTAQSPDATVVITSGYSSKIEIRELFPKHPLPPTEPQVIEVREINENSELPVGTGESIDMPAPVIEEPSSPPLSDEAESPEERQSARIPDEPDLSSHETSPAIPEEIVETEEDEEFEEIEEVQLEEMPSAEDKISNKIKAFEERLAMTCPVCKQGKILTDVTEKGKTYYFCSNEACGLVSWGRPYHFSCPVCENSYLVDFQQMDGGIGLKCPRATCVFEHRNFDGKTLPNALKTNGGNPAVRKVAVRKKGSGQLVRRKVVRVKK